MDKSNMGKFNMDKSNAKPRRFGSWTGYLIVFLVVIVLAGSQVVHALANGYMGEGTVYFPFIAKNAASGGTMPKTPVITPPPCPQATPQPLWIDPVVSPTERLTQTITVYLGDGELVSVISESGTFTATGDFDAQSNPALVTIPLLADTTHHLTVQGRVKERQQGHCTYGGYRLITEFDRTSQPLIIVQSASQ